MVSPHELRLLRLRKMITTINAIKMNPPIKAPATTPIPDHRPQAGQYTCPQVVGWTTQSVEQV